MHSAQTNAACIMLLSIRQSSGENGPNSLTYILSSSVPLGWMSCISRLKGGWRTLVKSMCLGIPIAEGTHYVHISACNGTVFAVWPSWRVIMDASAPAPISSAIVVDLIFLTLVAAGSTNAYLYSSLFIILAILPSWFRPHNTIIYGIVWWGSCRGRPHLSYCCNRL